MMYGSTVRQVFLFDGAFSVMRTEVMKLKFIEEKMNLVFPTMEYETQAKDFIAEFYEYDSEINGTGGLVPYLEKEDYSGWVKKILADIDVANVDEKKVPALTYFYIREIDKKIVGMVNIRLAENELIRTEAGHIGYCIRPTERRKHYASQMLYDSLKVCRRMRIPNVLVSCDKDNIASANTIKSCGGVLDAEFYSETYHEVLQRYVIVAE
jgi:predicted acetyltransferase